MTEEEWWELAAKASGLYQDAKEAQGHAETLAETQRELDVKEAMARRMAMNCRREADKIWEQIKDKKPKGVKVEGK